ncbi:MAG: Acetoin utilization protein AcuC [Candidatus Heimdallarchaeota archaeon LC_3]|nr:MAG: Acetoin utilization protein AcuC [Candidatus Heimdallarchaeota archaeon LC_3]
MTPKLAYIFSDNFFQYDLGISHPMNRKRLVVAHKLMQELKIVESELSNVDIITPKKAEEELVKKIHSEDYISEIKRLSKEPGFNYKFGLGTNDCPVFPDLYETSMLIAGATLIAGEVVLEADYDYSFVMMGGLHHAFPNKAGGFCYLNDLAILIKKLQTQGLRVAYIDTDLHHGDGTQHIFYDDPDVLTVSFHESGQFMFPGSGYPDELGEPDKAEGSSINFPLYKYTHDEPYLHYFTKYIPTIVQQFNPDIVVWQAGVDAHQQDPMGHLLLSSFAYEKLANVMKSLAKQTSTGKMIVTGGGGYNPNSTSRMWSVEIGTLIEKKLPVQNPLPWIKFCKQYFQINLQYKLRDTPFTPEKILDLYSIDFERINSFNTKYEETFYDEVSKYYNIPSP